MRKLNNKKDNKLNKGGLYIAICCFALVAAAIGYAGRETKNPSEKLPQQTPSTQSEQNKNSTNQTRFDSTTFNKNSNNEVIVIPEKNETKKSTQKKATDITVAKNVEVVDDKKFIVPIEGDILIAYSGDKLIYNTLLSDWRTHNGIDISCDENSAIYASSDGKIIDIFENSMGKSVKIDHENGYESVYSNLSDEIEVKIGDNVKAGDLLAKIGNTQTSDFTQKPHLHFEILYNNKYVDPQEMFDK